MPAKKLTDTQAEEIRGLYAETADLPLHIRSIQVNPERHTYASLAERYGVSEKTIEKIIKGQTYKRGGAE